MAKSKKMFFWLVPLLVTGAILILILFTGNVRAGNPHCTPPQTLQCSGNPIVCQCGGGDGGTSIPGQNTPIPGQKTPVPGQKTPMPIGTPSCNISGIVIIPTVRQDSTWGSGPINNQFGNFPKLPNGQQYCSLMNGVYDKCSNFLYWATGGMPVGIAKCSGPATTSTPVPPPISPCKNLFLDPSTGSVSCQWDFQWELIASVSMPPIVIDTRPYPVTLVNWPTIMRVNSLATNSGSGTLAYAGWGGGQPGSPQQGDWKNITLTLTFRPTGNPVTVTLAQQPAFTVSASAGGTKTFTWTVASHPAVGAVKTAGQVGQLSEIPGDMTLFQGNSMTTYRLFYTLTYQEYSTHTECRDSATPVPAVPPAIPPGPYQCKNLVTVGEWKSKSENGEILPSEVQNLPASMNGGSVYNDYSVVIRRMDDSGSTSNPAYAHQYSWGSIYYWACREGEGQEGWPSP